MGEEIAQTADDHNDYFQFVLEEVYGKSVEIVTTVIENNCAVNQAIAQNFDGDFLDFESHRFNSAVTDILQDNEELLEKAKAVMKTFSATVTASELLQVSKLNAKRCNETRQNSKFEMCTRYQESCVVLLGLHIHGLQDILLTSHKNITLREKVKQPGDLDKMTKSLQKATCALSNMRSYFMV